MKGSTRLWWLVILPAIVACNKTIDENHQALIETQWVTNYEPRRFSIDQRIEKIQTITEDLQSLFESHAKEHKIPGIAYGIVIDDSLVVASNTGVNSLTSEIPVSTKSSFRIASMSKSFTAMAILKLRDEGHLSLDNPVVSYIPELASLEYLTEDSPIIDIENLLTMTAGFPEDNPWGDRQLAITDDDFIELISKGLSMSNAPSYQYEYSNTGYAMLGRIISVVSGMSYQEYIKENIFKPLRMDHTYWEYSEVPEEQFVTGYRWEDDQWKEEPILHDGAYGSMGGLITSIEDFSKYVSYQLSAWPPRSEAESGPVKRSTLREMQTPQFNFLNSWATDLERPTLCEHDWLWIWPGDFNEL